MLPSYLEPYKEKGLIDFTSHAHNMYIHELAEDGVPGFIIVIGTQLYFCIKYFKVHHSASDPLLKAVSLGVGVIIIESSRGRDIRAQLRRCNRCAEYQFSDGCVGRISVGRAGS